MSPNQAFVLMESLTKALAIMDEKARRNEENNSYLLWFEEFQTVRSKVWQALETVKRIEVETD